jgi:hypothetical protein
MPDIIKVTCGRIPRVMPDGRQVPPDYYELTVNGSTAVLAHCDGDKKTLHDIIDEIILEIALREINELLTAHPDEQPYPENLPFSNEIRFDDGTVRYAPKDELMRILGNLVPLKAAAYVQPQGLISALPSGAPFAPKSFLDMLTTNGIPKNTDSLPRLQGLVAAPTSGRLPDLPDDSPKWKCTGCGAQNSGKFCTECGAPKPEEE